MKSDLSNVVLIRYMRTYTKILNELKEDIKQYDLNITEFAVLELLYSKGEQKIQDIAKKILITSGSTTYVIDKLCDKKYITRNVDEKDKRIYYAKLTRQGLYKMKKIMPKHLEKIKNIFSSITYEEQEFLLNILGRI